MRSLRGGVGKGKWDRRQEQRQERMRMREDVDDTQSDKCQHECAASTLFALGIVYSQHKCTRSRGYSLTAQVEAQGGGTKNK